MLTTMIMMMKVLVVLVDWWCHFTVITACMQLFHHFLMLAGRPGGEN